MTYLTYHLTYLPTYLLTYLISFWFLVFFLHNKTAVYDTVQICKNQVVRFLCINFLFLPILYGRDSTMRLQHTADSFLYCIWLFLSRISRTPPWSSKTSKTAFSLRFDSATWKHENMKTWKPHYWRWKNIESESKSNECKTSKTTKGSKVPKQRNSNHSITIEKLRRVLDGSQEARNALVTQASPIALVFVLLTKEVIVDLCGWCWWHWGIL